MNYYHIIICIEKKNKNHFIYIKSKWLAYMELVGHSVFIKWTQNATFSDKLVKNFKHTNTHAHTQARTHT